MTARQARHGRTEEGSDMVFTLIILPTVIVMGLGLAMTYFIRSAIQAPLPGIAESYTQMFAAYGSNTLPLYAQPEPGKRGQTVSALMTQAMVETGSVADDDPNNVAMACGPVQPDGTIINVINTGADIPANSTVGCTVTVEIDAWPYRSILPGAIPELLLGNQWTGYYTAHSNRGSNANLR